MNSRVMKRISSHVGPLPSNNSRETGECLSEPHFAIISRSESCIENRGAHVRKYPFFHQMGCADLLVEHMNL